MKQFTIFFLAIILSSSLFAQEPIMQWNFDNTSAVDTIEGLFTKVKGIKGDAVLLDGFTTRVVRKSEYVKKPTSEITIDAWIALGNYPWNWCPILTTESNEVKGYRLMVGPLGQVSMDVAISEQWVSCSSAKEAIPLRQWMHVTGTYSANNKLEIFVNGKLLNSIHIKGTLTYTNHTDCILGMTASKDKPYNIHRTWGTVGQYFGLDGKIDEIKVYDKVLSNQTINDEYIGTNVPEAGIEPRHLPIVKSTRKFHAYYTKLKYYPGWDNVWPVADDPDIVVCFEKTPIKVVFWRGTRYEASWITENENWMTDQSVEAWGEGSDDTEGCFEHMQDRHCRFSHVRIIENTPGRIVVHWRYAPVSSHNNTWNIDEKTGWECWVDEYYYIYPDGSAIRKVTWKKGSLGPVRQFQETLALLSPGQTQSELMEVNSTTVSDYEGNRGSQSFMENPVQNDTYKNYTIQRYNFKSKNKPFLCFEPGNVMNLRNSSMKFYDKAAGCNHFPVGQARCDGRTTIMSDRPSHCTSFPISDPVIHNGKDRNYWCALSGMTDKSMDELQLFGRSWAYAPVLTTLSKGVESEGYDRSERCYKLSREKAKPTNIKLQLAGTKTSPIINPAFYIKNWDGKDVTVLVNGKKQKDITCGVYKKLNRNDLIVFLFINKSENLNIVIQPK